jgi:hypothetical protein
MASDRTADDLQHLRLLSIFHYVIAGLAAICAMIPILHLTIGIAIVTGQFPQPAQPGPQPRPGGPPPEMIGWLFIVFASAIILLGWAYAIGMAVAGYMISRRRWHTFCLVMAGIACLHTPLGTVLGVFTIIVLIRPSVRKLFVQNRPTPTDEDPYDPPPPEDY